MSAVVVVGGTAGLGLELARHYAKQGREVVVTGRDQGRATAAAEDIGGRSRGIAFDLSKPFEIGPALADVGPVQHIALAAVARDHNTVDDYNVAAAMELMTMKLVGYTEVVHALRGRLSDDSSILVFGGQVFRRPYQGSTTLSTANGGVIGMVHSFAVELAPIRANAIFPGVVGDSPYWAAKPAEVRAGFASRTPTGKLATMADIVGACVFLLENPAMNGEDLTVDGGWLLL